jgi:hypothetical protein
MLRGGLVGARLWTLSIWLLVVVVALPLASSAQGVVVLSFLTGANTNVALTPNVETLIWDFSVYPPASPNFQQGQHILPGAPVACAQPIDPSRCPDYWAVLVVLTPITMFNDSSRSGVVTMTVYSDNSYVYQHRVTVAARSYVPISAGALSLGYIMNSAPDIPMPVRVSVSATERMTAVRDTGQPSMLLPGAPRVWGAMVELRPM